MPVSLPNAKPRHYRVLTSCQVHTTTRKRVSGNQSQRPPLIRRRLRVAIPAHDLHDILLAGHNERVRASEERGHGAALPAIVLAGHANRNAGGRIAALDGARERELVALHVAGGGDGRGGPARHAARVEAGDVALQRGAARADALLLAHGAAVALREAGAAVRQCCCVAAGAVVELLDPVAHVHYHGLVTSGDGLAGVRTRLGDPLARWIVDERYRLCLGLRGSERRCTAGAGCRRR